MLCMRAYGADKHVFGGHECVASTLKSGYAVNLVAGEMYNMVMCSCVPFGGIACHK